MISNNKKINLAFFFTCGVSLKVWDEIGIAHREIALYNKLAEHLNTIVFFTYGDSSDLNYKKYLAPNIRIVPKPCKMHNKLYSLLLPIIHRRILKTCNILKTNQMDGSWSAVLSKILFRKKLIIRTGYCYSTFIKHCDLKLRYIFAKMVERIAYTFADAAIVTSQKDKNYVALQYNYKHINLIPNSVDTHTFYPQNTVKKEKTLCFVGRLSEEKNLFSLIRALKNTGIGLTLIGDGKLKQQLLECAKENKVHAQFYGIIPNNKLPEMLNQFEVFILPSYFEGSPKALLEAMACGLCVIGTNVEGIREVIQNNRNGFLCDTNVDSLRSTILSVFEDNAARHKVKNNAATFIMNNYSLDRLFKKELQLYAELLFNS